MASPVKTNLDDFIRPNFFVDFVRQLEFPAFQLVEFFPPKEAPDNIYEFDKTSLAPEPAVSYRSWDQAVPIGTRQGIQKGMAALPALGKMKLMTEEQLLKKRAMESGNWSRYIDQIYDDIGNLAEGVQSRWEIDRGTLLTAGTLTVNGTDGWAVTVDYQVPSGNKPTANVLWSDTANADIIGDLTLWQTAYRAQNRGLSPGGILIGEAVVPYLLKNASLRATMYFGAPNTGPSTLRIDDVQAELQAHGLPRFRVITSQATNESGTTGVVFPQNKVVFLPPAGIEIGYTAYGTTGAALGLVEEGVIPLDEAAGIIGFTKAQTNPARRENHIDACGMPVLSNPNLLFVAGVAA